MTDEREKSGPGPFISRWSRLKSEARQEQPSAGTPADIPAIDAGAPAPDLPPLDELSITSDFRPFFHPKVDEGLRRAALRKLFSDPHFNVMDGLDVYIDDYSQPSPLPAEMLAQLSQARNILRWAQESRDDAAAAQSKAIATQADRSPAAVVDGASESNSPVISQADTVGTPSVPPPNPNGHES